LAANSFTTRDWFVYTTDAAASVACLIPAWQGKESDLGFSESDGSDPPIDDQRRMRRILIAHPTDGRKRYLPVGNETCDAWATPGTTITIKERNDVTGTAWSIVSQHNEKRPRLARDIHSY
jgi:hypothetical protein